MHITLLLYTMLSLVHIAGAITHNVQVWYLAKGTKPPSQELCSSGGKAFQIIFGGRTTLLENFLIKRKVL
jgi:hypothetical protein